MGSFSIDLNEEFVSLSNAPIVEAVLQFNAPPSIAFQQAELKDLLAKEFGGYKLHDQMQHETEFQSSADGNVAMHHRSQWDGFRLHSEDASIRFVQNLPLGFPQPAVSGEPDGHINFEWYRSSRRVLSVSIGPNNRLFWAALIGTESPRGSARYIERIPEIILDQIARVFEGD